MKKKLFKVLLTVVVVVAVGSGGYYIYKNYASKSTSASTTRFATAKVTKTNLDVTVDATGTVDGIDAVNVYSSNSGLLSGMTPKQGDYVNKGDLFCKIDDTDTQQQVQNDEISLEHSKLQLQSLEDQMDSLSITAPMDGVIKSVFVAPGDDTTSMKSAYGGMAVMTAGTDDSLEINIPFPSAGGKVEQVYASAGQSVKKGDILFKMDDTSLQNSIAQQENLIEQAQNTLNDAEANLSKSTISTPISGIVSVLNVKNGENINTSSPTLIATITDTSKMQVTLPVDELDINKVQVGQKATISIDDIGNGKTFTGEVQSIAQSGTTTNNVTTYNVIVSIDNPQDLKIGMNANVSIAVQSKENVLAVPSESIITRNGKSFVMVSSSGQTQESNNGYGNNQTQGKNNGSGSNQGQGRNRGSGSNQAQGGNSSFGGRLVPVETGLKTKTMTEITSGVTEGETILIQLPQSTSSNNSNRGGFGGMGGGSFGGGSFGGGSGKSAGN